MGKAVIARRDVPALSGDLAQIGLPTLLSMMDMERRGGVLEIVRRPGCCARLWLRTGRVVRALVLGAGPRLTGLEAVYEVLGWSEGRFVLRGAEAAVGHADLGGAELGGAELGGSMDEVNCSTAHLLLDGARRRDEAGLAA